MNYLFEVPHTHTHTHTAEFHNKWWKLPPLVAMYFSACISTDWVDETVLSWWLHVCFGAAEIRKKLCCSRTKPCFMQRCFHVAPEIAIKRFKVCTLARSCQLILPYETAQETFGIEQVLLIVWMTRGNSSLRCILR